MSSTTAERMNSCQDCGRDDVPFAGMTHAPKNRSGVTNRCLRCNTQYKRRQERRLANADRGADGGIVEVGRVPSSPELSLLGELLAENKHAALPFDQVYDESVRLALSILKSRERPPALEILAWAKPFFAAAYCDQRVSRLTTDLIAEDPQTRQDVVSIR
jgi:hypothetical protein